VRWPWSADRAARAGSSAAPQFASPVLQGRYPMLRFKIVWLLLCFGFVAVIVRAAWVQVIHPDFLLDKAEQRMVKHIVEPAPRGRLLDRHGQVLAASVQVAALWLSPRAYREAQQQLARAGAAAARAGRGPRDEQRDQRALAELLELDMAEVAARFADLRAEPVLKRQVPWELSERVMALKIPGVYRTVEFKRIYPGGEALAQLLGTQQVNGPGLDGLELAFDAQLTGQPGRRRVLRDQLGRTIDTVEQDRKPSPGQDLRLSIDSQIQFHAHRAVAEAQQQRRALAASAIVADLRTGEILALVNAPSFDPNRRDQIDRAQLKPLLRNRVINDSFEPGSTMKPLTVALALESGLVRSDTVLSTAPGRMALPGGHVIEDHHNLGDLSVAQIVQKSSNVGTAKLALRLPRQDHWNFLVSLGFGQKPLIEAPGATPGSLRHYRNWGGDATQATMGYGYGLRVSILQLARAYSALGRDGDLVPFTLMRRELPRGATVPGTRVMSAETARQVRLMLQAAASSGGTAPQARTPAYSVGGKTGTARKHEKTGYAKGKYNSFFVGLAPIGKPRIVVAVMVDEPRDGQYYAGVVAAPVFAEIVQHALRALGEPPDLSVRPEVAAVAIEESF
jgi:cell division protein FtsI (penicillin-binding protein 3)